MQADARSIDALRQIGAQDFAIAVVAVGSSIESSVLITANLVDLKIPQIWAKAISQSHGKILARIGANHVIYPRPRRASASPTSCRDACSTSSSSMMTSPSSRCTRRSHPRRLFTESKVRAKYGITVVGVKSPGKDFTYADSETVISNHDLVIVSGNSADIERFASLTA